MKQQFAVLPLVSFLIILSACSNSYQEKVLLAQQDIQASVVSNADAKSYDQWEMSDAHPSRLFDALRAKDDRESNDAFCESLLALPGQKLQVFEAEINSEENKAMLAKCELDVEKKLEEHHQAQRLLMQRKGKLTLADADSKQDVSKNSNTAVGGTDQIPNEEKEMLTTEIQYRDMEKGYGARTGDVKKKQVILTFDDGPDFKNTPIVLKALKAVGAKASFFMLGRNAERFSDTVKLVAKDGHSVANHSYNHAYMGNLDKCSTASCRSGWVSAEKAKEQIRKTHQILFDILGFVDPLFRFPYGASTSELKNFLKENKTAEFHWNVDSEDWNMKYSNEEVISNTLKIVKSEGRGILLFHDIHRRTAELLPEVLSGLVQQGYQFVLLKPSNPELRFVHPFIKPRLP